MLVILECRDRGGVQDVSWIDQVVGKRDDVGADKAIAVSQSGFTGAAQKHARSVGDRTRDGVLMNLAEAEFMWDSEKHVVSVQDKPNNGGPSERAVRIYGPKAHLV